MITMSRKDYYLDKVEKYGFPLNVYCFLCGEKFLRESAKDYSDCPHCNKGFKDLTPEAKFAVKQVVKTWKEHLL